jgi:hypothetical protein
MKLKASIFLLTLSVFSSCYYNEGPAEFPAGEVMGYKPVYATEDEFEIVFSDVQSVENPGKIYIYNQYLLVNDQLKGVHVFNNSDPSNPQSLGFIRIIGNVDIAIKGNILYADQINDLVAIDISDIAHPREVDRAEFVYPDRERLPPLSNNYFECVDRSKSHLLKGWILAQLTNPECFR